VEWGQREFMSGSDAVKYLIDPDKCISCGICAIVCPKAAIAVLSEGKRFIIAGRCNGCGLCAGQCIGLAINRVNF
jgi:Pyruvate/2-oxoacid:ferredoxin oxidoreductase delta subunit